MAEDTHYNSYYLEPGQHQVPRIQKLSCVCPLKLRIWRCFWPHIPWILRHQCSSCSSFHPPQRASFSLSGLWMLTLSFSFYSIFFVWEIPSSPVASVSTCVCDSHMCIAILYISSELQNNSHKTQLCNMNVYSKAHLRSASPLLSSFTVNGITSPNCPSRNMVSCLPLNFFLYLMTHTWYLVYSISSIPVSSVGFSPFPLLLS